VFQNTVITIPTTLLTWRFGSIREVPMLHLCGQTHTRMCPPTIHGASPQVKCKKHGWIDIIRGILRSLCLLFGATEFPTSAGVDPVKCGTDLANFVKTNQLDGVDLDYEDNDAMEKGKGEEWLIQITRTLRQLLPREQGYIISHAPQAPYFMGPPKYPNGGYLTVDKQVGSLIDYYNVQFYNQAQTSYSSYQTLFQTSDGWATDTAVAQMIAKGIPSSKIVVGKPITTGDASNTGYVSVDTLRQMFQTARSSLSWNAGFMGWQFKSDTDGSWSNKLASAF